MGFKGYCMLIPKNEDRYYLLIDQIFGVKSILYP